MRTLASSLVRVSLLCVAPTLLGCGPAPTDGDGGPEDGADAGPQDLPGEDAGPDVPEDAGETPVPDGGVPVVDDAGVDAGVVEPPPPPTITVTGTSIDFQTRAQLAVATTVTTVDILPPPDVQVTNASFSLTNVAGNSIFRLLVGGVGYKNSYSLPVQVAESDINGVTVEVASAAFVTSAAATFGVTPAAGTGVLIARAVDENSAAVAGVPANAFYLNGAAPAAGPYFLDAARQPDDTLTATSTSGYAMFFNVPAGAASVGESPASAYSLASSPAPIASDTVTRLNVRAQAGDFVLPVGVDFEVDVLGVFDTKGCNDCHSGNGIGRDLGGLTLDASPNLIYGEVKTEVSNKYGVARVNLVDPEASVLLVVPTTGPPIHPIQMFAGYTDPDYLKLLSWITDGAPRN